MVSSACSLRILCVLCGSFFSLFFVLALGSTGPRPARPRLATLALIHGLPAPSSTYFGGIPTCRKMSDSFKDHYSVGSADYAAFRPTYPESLVSWLAGIAPAHDTAVDCGCGPGELTTLLASRFARVIAIDASASQLECATPHERVEYRQARAEATGLDDASADLVCAAQAAHWFDLDPFYAEVRRVLRPGGAIALITYGVVEMAGDAGAVLSRFYFDEIGSWWPPERRHVESGYQSLPFPFNERRAPKLAMEASWTADQLLGYVGTWSAVKNARAGLGREPLDRLSAELRDAWGDVAVRRAIRWPLSMRIGEI